MKKNILILFVSCISFTTFAQKKIHCFNLHIGETYYQTVHSTSNIEQQISGQTIQSKVFLSSKSGFKILNFIDSMYIIELEFLHFLINMKLPNNEINIDTDEQINDTNQNISHKLMKLMVGKKCILKMTKFGKVYEVKNIDSIIDNVVNQFKTLNSDQKNQFKQQLIQTCGENALKGNFELASNIFANYPVDLNDTWQINTNVVTNTNFKVVTDYTFKEKTDLYNLFVGIGQMQTQKMDEYTRINGYLTKYNLTGLINSKIKTDINTGWVLESEVIQNVNGDLQLKDVPNLPNNLLIPMSINTISNYSAK